MPTEVDTGEEQSKDVVNGMTVLQQNRSWGLEDTDGFDYSMPSAEEADTSVKEEVKVPDGVALSTRAQREERRRKSPWERRWKRPFKGKLAPFGSKAVFLNDGTSKAMGKLMKYEPSGRAGLLIGYGPIGSFLVLDYRPYAERTRIVLKLTRDRRLYPDEFPLAAAQPITATHLNVVGTMERDYKGEEKVDSEQPTVVHAGLRFGAKVGAKSRTCDKRIVAPGMIPRCGKGINPGSKVKRQYGVRCKIG